MKPETRTTSSQPPRQRRLVTHLVRALPLITLVGVAALAAPRCRVRPPAATRPLRPAACCAPAPTAMPAATPAAMPAPTPAALPAVDAVTGASPKLWPADTWAGQSF